jgi:hypothetical protein
MTDIKDQKLSEDADDSIHDLPQGLNGYYNKHWIFMENAYKDRFQEIDEKVIRIIAALQKPALISYIAEIGKFPKHKVAEIINLWRNFLNKRTKDDDEKIKDDECRYCIYHRSFYDFLKRKFHFDDITSFDGETHYLITKNTDDKIDAGEGSENNPLSKLNPYELKNLAFHYTKAKKEKI